MTSAVDQRVFFGWYLVAFTFVMQFLAMGTGFYVFGVLLVPLTETLQADRFLVSLALSLQTLSSALLSPWVGRMVAERSVRVLMAVLESTRTGELGSKLRRASRKASRMAPASAPGSRSRIS